MLIERHGDIFTSTAPAIGHGVNVCGVMGAGIAVEFRRRWPDMYGRYRDACRTGRLEPGGLFPYQCGTHDSPFQWVYNIASQDRPGPHARLGWLRAGMQAMVHHARSAGIDLVALPRIGCGIGGLTPSLTHELFTRVADGPVDIELWTFVARGEREKPTHGGMR